MRFSQFSAARVKHQYDSLSVCLLFTAWDDLQQNEAVTQRLQQQNLSYS